jgi:hypothetical protein
MPGRDRTGPLGFGPRTGRAAGYCARYPAPGYMNPTFGRGFGRGGGRGRRNRYYATGLTGWQRAAYGMPYAVLYPPADAGEQELAALKRQAEYLENDMNSIKKRIEELEKEVK